MKNPEVRIDMQTGAIWLVDAPRHAPIRRVKDITNDVMFALCAETVFDGIAVERSIRFADGTRCLVNIQMEEVTSDATT